LASVLTVTTTVAFAAGMSSFDGEMETLQVAGGEGPAGARIA